jgi:RNA polymerase sigma factor (sigma-70 family)
MNAARMSGMDESFVARFEELYGVGYRASFAVLGNRADAEECAQEACARALVRWRRVQTYAPAWVARVATNQAIDRARRRMRADRAVPQLAASAGLSAGGSTGSSSGQSSGQSSGTADSAVLSARRHDLVVALDALPRKQREMVVLRYLVDLSEQQTADALQCSVGTVKSSTARGLEKLRSRLGPQWAWEN